MPQSVLEMTKDLILAEIRSGVLAPEDMQDALRRTYQSLIERSCTCAMRVIVEDTLRAV